MHNTLYDTVNEMNWILGHFCSRPGEPLEDGEMSDMTLPSRGLKFEPWRSEAEHSTSRLRRLPTVGLCMIQYII